MRTLKPKSVARKIKSVAKKIRDKAARRRKYSDRSFWKRIKELVAKIARGGATAGKGVVYRALVLYYCLQDDDTPSRAKVIIVAALSYFVSPVDLVPDIFPGTGYIDDLAVLAGAFALVFVSIKPEHRQEAKDKMKEWFGDGDDPPAE